jgi:NhaA family Na+:H+ antiporter
LVKTGVARKPFGATWLHIYGVAALAGISFIMSLFIGGLSFEDPFLMNEVRIGVVSGSVISAILVLCILRVAPMGHTPHAPDEHKTTDSGLQTAEM